MLKKMECPLSQASKSFRRLKAAGGPHLFLDIQGIQKFQKGYSCPVCLAFQGMSLLKCLGVSSKACPGSCPPTPWKYGIGRGLACSSVWES